MKEQGLNNINTDTVVGLIKGRHPLPVDKYIFEDDIEDVLDFDSLAKHVEEFCVANCNIRNQYYVGLNQNDPTDVMCYVGDPLVVYVTGLTSVTVAVIRCCALNGIPLTLMHFDRASGDYVPQRIF